MDCRMTLRRTCAAFALALSAAANAQDYPSKPVRVIVPWPPGGLVDAAGRVVGEKLAAALGQPFVLDNKPGAGGVIGAEQAAKAPADGYTLVLTTSALTMNAALQAKLPFDVLRDFEPIAAAAHTPQVLVAYPGLGFKSVQDLIAAAKARPGRMSYASAGNGSPAHLAGELFKSMLGLDILHVPYKGAPPAMTDQIAGRVDFHFANAAVALPQVRAGKVQGLAVASAQRAPFAPELPTMAEAGVANFEADQWVGYLAPRGTPRAVIERLNAAIGRALSSEDAKALLAQSGMAAAAPATPAQFGAALKADLARWSAVVKSANIRPE